MRRRVVVGRGLGLLAMALTQAASAEAQLPVCAQPTPTQTYYTACATGGRILVARLLGDLAVDHLMKADSQPVQRRLGDLLRNVTSDDTRDKNTGLRNALDLLAPLTLTKIDTATGTLLLTIEDDRRRFSGTLEGATTSTTLSWELPPRIGGGYWRTPATIQIAFWAGQRFRFDLESATAEKVSAEIECLAISVDGIRIVTTGVDTPDILVRFDECS